MGCKSEDVGILESNSFNVANIDSLEGELKSLVERRAVLGPCYRLFYQKPLHLVRGKGTRLFDADGVEYLDMYNNIPSMGHSNPAITEAVTKQLQLLNTHTRYVHENILDYAEDLLSTMPDEINRIMFMCSGSEANDLAVRCAQLYTGGGRDHRYRGGLPRQHGLDLRPFSLHRQERCHEPHHAHDSFARYVQAGDG